MQPATKPIFSTLLLRLLPDPAVTYFSSLGLANKWTTASASKIIIKVIFDQSEP